MQPLSDHIGDNRLVCIGEASHAWSTRLVPESCEADVVELLVEVRRRARHHAADDEAAFDATRNATPIS